MQNYTCACCGHFTLDDRPGSYEICRVCFWEDDPVQLLDPWCEGGANQPALIQAQANYAEFGAAERRFIENVAGAQADDRKDPSWRRVTEHDRRFVRLPRDLTPTEQRDLDLWYYWKRPAG